ncbi:MAG TPA: DUF3800 domain-containing protein [Candidatus Tumulicola sp.]
MFMLQAYFDDSGNLGQGKFSVLGGYVATTEVWSDFSDRWASALATVPTIAYLKTSHAMLLKGEFSGWTPEARDRKIASLLNVIHQTNISYGAVEILDNASCLRFSDAMPRLKDPFPFLAVDLMQSCIKTQVELGSLEQVDFIFDSSDMSEGEMANYFNRMMSTAPPELRGLIKNPPVFRDERKFLPLQASDLVVNRLRRDLEDDGSRETARAALDRLSELDVIFATAFHSDESLGNLLAWHNVIESLRGR